MITRKLYQKLAAVFSESLVDRTEHHNWPNAEWYKDRLWTEMLDRVCVVLAEDNEMFDEDKFRKACNGVRI